MDSFPKMQLSVRGHGLHGLSQCVQCKSAAEKTDTDVGGGLLVVHGERRGVSGERERAQQNANDDDDRRRHHATLIAGQLLQ